MIAMWKVKYQYISRSGDVKEITYSVVTKKLDAPSAIRIAEREIKKSILEYSLIGVEYLGKAYQ